MLRITKTPPGERRRWRQREDENVRTLKERWERDERVAGEIRGCSGAGEDLAVVQGRTEERENIVEGRRYGGREKWKFLGKSIFID